jgi:hypothetical protein
MRNGLAFSAGDAVAMADAMERIADDNNLRDRLARGARLWAEERSWSAELDRLDCVYREVIGSTQPEEHISPLPSKRAEAFGLSASTIASIRPQS